MGMGALRPLPPNTAPTGTRCIQITIPDDDEWERDLYSVITELGQWPRWARDEAHSATLVARRWRAALRTFRYCDGTPAKTIEEFEDEMALCDQFRYHDGKLQVMCCGEWTDITGQDTGDGPPTHEMPRDPRPAPTDSNCYNLALDAKGVIRLPFSVSDGDTITITDVQGEWSDGTVDGFFCPDGGGSVYGGCFGAGALDGGDPASALVHMRLVYSVGSVWFDGYNTTTVLSGVGTNQQLTLQANDGDLPDNQGGVTFKFCVQNGETPPAEEWCFEMDFRLSNYGGTNRPGESIVYTPGTGWDTTGAGAGACGFLIPFPAPAHVTSIEVYTNRVSGFDSNIGLGYNNFGGGGCGSMPNGATSGYEWEDCTDDHTPVSSFAYDCNSGRGGGNEFQVAMARIHGTGPNPFPASNC